MIRVDLCSQGEVVFTSMTNAYRSIHILEVPLAELVQIDTTNIIIDEMSVFRYYSFDTHQLRSHEHLSHDDTCAQVTMAEVDMLSDEDLPQDWCDVE